MEQAGDTGAPTQRHGLEKYYGVRIALKTMRPLPPTHHHSMTMSVKTGLPLPGLAAILVLACGRTGTVRRSQPDASQDQGQDACCAGDLAATDVDGGSELLRPPGGEVLWPVIELVVDISASMQDPVTGTGQSGWEMTRDTLKRVISRLTPASPAIGLTLFPNQGDCVSAPMAVPAAPISEQTRAQLIAALDSVAIPVGARPTAAALALAQTDATGKVFANGPSLQPWLVLLTAGTPDSSPACGAFGDPILALKDQAQAAWEKARVPTCVFALPGAGPARDTLIEVAKAEAGATLDAGSSWYCFEDCDQGASAASILETGLECVLAGGFANGSDCLPTTSGEGEPRSCFVLAPSLSAPNVDPDNVTVVITPLAASPRVVPRVDCSSAAADGWDFGPDRRSVTFCGQSCSDFLASWSYSITVGCKGG